MSPFDDSTAASRPREPQPAAAADLDKLRTKLLDLTLANRLLGFRHTKRSSLRVVDELPDVLWSRLRDGDELLFLPVPAPPPNALVPQEPEVGVEGAAAARVGRKQAMRKPTAIEHARSLGLAMDIDLPEPAPGGQKDKLAHRDARIQTPLYPQDLEASLRTIASAARSALEETGTNMLHLVFGFLEWFDDESVDKPLFAPVMTLPVTLRRGDVDARTRTYRYHIAYSGEDAVTNSSLQEKLKRDFGIALPVVDDEELPEAYFARVREAVGPMPAWRVRRQITLALLSFGKLLMVRDLDPARWPPDAGPLAHPRARELFEGIEQTAYEVGREYQLDDPALASSLPSLVLDADSSQHSALLDALNGRNLVIQGPPGTGKSQTITNLIAAALVRGKSVLFVAEKLAALEVVRRRLDAVGLGVFCLELHSHKTQRMQMLRDVRTRLEARGTFADTDALDEQLEVWRAARDALVSHAELLHAPHGALRWTIYDILWGAALRRQQLGELADVLDGVQFPDPTPWMLADLEAVKTRVVTYGRHLAAVFAQAPSVAANPWCGVTRIAKHREAKKELFGGLRDVQDRASELAALVSQLRDVTAAGLEGNCVTISGWLPDALALASHRNLEA
ncbi:MAG: DUF4011 domain-containing protein, partial [Polyangiaceae bacterium]|nr:DUF4011 domain-containing protein [Polyangiaceae bacterium]